MRDAIRREPKSCNPRLALGIFLKNKRDLAGAEVEFREAVRLAPTSPIPSYWLGSVLRERGSLDEAVLVLREGVRLDGNRIGSNIYSLAEVLLTKGDFDGAIGVYQEAFRLDPKNLGRMRGTTERRYDETVGQYHQNRNRAARLSRQRRHSDLPAEYEHTRRGGHKGKPRPSRMGCSRQLSRPP